MATDSQLRLAVIFRADVVGSTAFVPKDERVTHNGIQAAFERLFNPAEEDAQNVPSEVYVAMDEIPKPFRWREDSMPHRGLGKHMVDQMGGRLGHPARVSRAVRRIAFRLTSSDITSATPRR